MTVFMYKWGLIAVQIERFLVVHHKEIRFLLWLCLLVLLPQILGGSGCEASESKDMPWSKGVNVLFEEFTDTLPRIGSGISIAVAAALWMFGESQITKTAMRIAFGTGICLSAPSMINALTGTDVSGCLF